MFCALRKAARTTSLSTRHPRTPVLPQRRARFTHEPACQHTHHLQAARRQSRAQRRRVPGCAEGRSATAATPTWQT
eukprot:366140-Chlamydomonas_euryale.AAC.5